MKALAIVLIVAGSIMMVITGINVVSKEKVVDLGKVEINKTKNNPVSWSPIVGGVLLVAGIAVLFMNKKKVV
jgi:LPXTG-motif cell wall-anchored protein